MRVNLESVYANAATDSYELRRNDERQLVDAPKVHVFVASKWSRPAPLLGADEFFHAVVRSNYYDS